MASAEMAATQILEQQEVEMFSLRERVSLDTAAMLGTFREHVIEPVTERGALVAATAATAVASSFGLAGAVEAATSYHKYLPLHGTAIARVIKGYYARGCNGTVTVNRTNTTERHSNVGKLHANFEGEEGVWARLTNVPHGAVVCGAIGNTVSTDEQVQLDVVHGKIVQNRKIGDGRRITQLAVYIKPGA